MCIGQRWSPLAANSPLREDAIQVWLIDLDDGESLPRSERGPWSEAERQHAARQHDRIARRRWLVGRSAVRDVLAGYLHCSPRSVAVEKGPNGRPRLAPANAPAQLDFNVAHSEHVLLCAVTRCGRVGVDVERIRPLDDLRALLDIVPTSSERVSSSQSNDRNLLLGFFRAWTAHEALAKAIGVGLELPFDAVHSARVGNTTFATVRGDVRGRRWSLVELDPVQGFVGALATAQANVPIELRRWKGVAP